MRDQNLTCIGCPLGCSISVSLSDNGEVSEITGNTCKKGEEYARKEVTNPSRVVTSIVKINNGDVNMVSVKTAEDLQVYGIKTFFCSNVCAAYRKEIYDKLGGFVERTIFNEDMIYAGNLIKAGYGIAYAADAKVWHWHNYTAKDQLKRNFDLAVSQVDAGGLFTQVKSESEGIRLVKMTLKHFIKKGQFYYIPKIITQNGAKYIGYRLGKNYKKLPKKWILKISLNPWYWK